MHWRGTATNRAMPSLLACAGETTAEGGSEGRLQPQSEGRRGACIKWAHSPTSGPAEMPFATGNGQKAGEKLVHPGPRFEKSHQPAQVTRHKSRGRALNSICPVQRLYPCPLSVPSKLNISGLWGQITPSCGRAIHELRGGEQHPCTLPTICQ